VTYEDFQRAGRERRFVVLGGRRCYVSRLADGVEPDLGRYECAARGWTWLAHGDGGSTECAYVGPGFDGENPKDLRQ
jgi:hypothetical protein